MAKLRSAAIIAALFFYSVNIFAQDYQQEFEQLFEEGKFDEIQILLDKWEAEQPKSPEMFISQLSYYNKISQKTIINFPEEQPEIEGQEKQYNDDEMYGYISSTVVYNDSLLNIGVAYIDKGIANIPNRIDMHLSKLIVLNNASRHEQITDAVITLIELTNKKSKTIWLDVDNKPNEAFNEQTPFLIQSYVDQLFNLEPPYYSGLERILTAMQKNQFTKSLYHFTEGKLAFYHEDYDTAIRSLLKAHKHDPSDLVIIKDIAYIYGITNEKAKAIEYYNKIVEVGSPDNIKFAKKKIEALKK